MGGQRRVKEGNEQGGEAAQRHKGEGGGNEEGLRRT